MTSLNDAVRRTQRRGFGFDELTPEQRAADAVRGVDEREESASLLADSVLREIDRDRRREWAKRGIEVDRDGVHVNGTRLYAIEQLSDPATRATLNARYEGAFRAYLRNALAEAPNGRGTDERARQTLLPAEQAALREGVAEGGGYLLPAPLAGQIASTRAAISVVRGSGAPVIPVPRGGVLRVPVAADHADNPERFEGGWVGGWTSEVPSDVFTATDEPTFELVQAPLSKAMAGLRISQDLLADSDVDLTDWLLTTGARNLAALEDHAFLDGDGVGGSPLGILRQVAAGDVIDVEGSGAAITAASLSKFHTLMAIDGQYRANATWAMRPSVEAKIRNIFDAGGHAPFAAYGNTLMSGYAVRSSSAIPADGVADNRCVVFADFSSAVVVGEQPLVVRISDSLYRRQDQAAIILTQRSACVLVNPRAFRVGAC